MLVACRDSSVASGALIEVLADTLDALIVDEVIDDAVTKVSAAPVAVSCVHSASAISAASNLASVEVKDWHPIVCAVTVPATQSGASSLTVAATVPAFRSVAFMTGAVTPPALMLVTDRSRQDIEVDTSTGAVMLAHEIDENVAFVPVNAENAAVGAEIDDAVSVAAASVVHEISGASTLCAVICVVVKFATVMAVALTLCASTLCADRFVTSKSVTFSVLVSISGAFTLTVAVTVATFSCVHVADGTVKLLADTVPAVTPST